MNRKGQWVVRERIAVILKTMQFRALGLSHAKYAPFACSREHKWISWTFLL